MAAKRASRGVTERNKNGTERYASKAAMGRHERTEPASQRKAEGDSPRKKPTRKK